MFSHLLAALLELKYWVSDRGELLHILYLFHGGIKWDICKHKLLILRECGCNYVQGISGMYVHVMEIWMDHFIFHFIK